jgi:hypothetical protein
VSFEGMLWASRHAPVADVYERAVLVVLGEAADNDGTAAYPSQDTIAEAAVTDARTVRRRLAAMEERGLIARGNQRLVEHIPADRRPVVWDLQIPAAWFPDLGEINQKRARKGMPPLTEKDRPVIAPPPPRTRRADAGKRKPKSPEKAPETGAEPTREDYETGGTHSPAGLSDRSDRTTSPQRGDSQSYKPVLDPALEPENLPDADASAPGEVVDLFGKQDQPRGRPIGSQAVDAWARAYEEATGTKPLPKHCKAVGSAAKRLTAEGVSAEEILTAARNCGAAGWVSLDQQLLRDRRRRLSALPPAAAGRQSNGKPAPGRKVDPRQSWMYDV